MTAAERLERTVKIFGLIVELGKMLAFLGLATFVVGAIAAPEWIGMRLDKLNLKLDSVNAGIVKLVSKEATKASANTLQVAEALTRAEVEVTDQLPSEQAKNVLKSIQEAKRALDNQSTSILAVGSKTGLAHQIPSTGWLYVGYFSKTGEAKRLSDRLAPAGVKYEAGKLSSVVLEFDAPVVSDGDNCALPDITNFVPPDPKAPERKYVIIQASAEPIRVITAAECPAVGDGKTIYAQVSIPKNRVRFSELSNLDR